MSRYHHLVDVHAENADLITNHIKTIVEAIEAGELNKARRLVMGLENQTARMETAFEEMSLLVRVLMLEFQATDDMRCAGLLPRSRRNASALTQREVQLELFSLLSDIQAKRRA